MKRLFAVAIASLACALALAGCASRPSGAPWVTLIDEDKGLENWNRIGDANWHGENRAIVADRGKGGFLVSKNAYKDFMLYAEFYANSDTNSGIFIRATDPAKIGADSSYEVNIWDIRPDPSYGTAGIVNFAKVPVPPVYKAGGKWNTLEIYARGSQISVKFNGEVTASIQSDKFPAGPVALQFGPGVNNALGGPIRWRNVQIRPL
jgi:hypothetical protein